MTKSNVTVTSGKDPFMFIDINSSKITALLYSAKTFEKIVTVQAERVLSF